MPAQFEIINPDNAISFFEVKRDGEPYYLKQDDDGSVVLSGDGAGDLYAMLIAGEGGAVELSVFKPGHVMLDGEWLNGEKPLHPWSEIRIDAHTFILLPDDDSSAIAPANVPIWPVAAIESEDKPRIRVSDVRFMGTREGVSFYKVVVLASGTEQTQLQRVKLEAQVSQIQGQFMPLPASQQSVIDPVFQSGDIINLRHNDQREIDLQVQVKPSSLLRAGVYGLRVTATSINQPAISNSNDDAVLEVQAFAKYTLSDPVPITHPFWRFWSAMSKLSITNDGNSPASYDLEAENAMGSDLRAEWQLLPRHASPAASALTPALPSDTSAFETSWQPQKILGLSILPGETRQLKLKMLLAPQSRPLISLRHSRQQLNITVATKGAPPITKAVRWVTVPAMLGPLRLLFLLIVAAWAIALHVNAMNTTTRFGYSINDRKVDCPQTEPSEALRSGDLVTLTVCTEPFTDIQLETIPFNATPKINSISSNTGNYQKVFTADRSVSFRLTATHPLGRLLPWPPFVVQRSLDFNVGRQPDWGIIGPLTVTAGSDVTVFWDKLDRVERLTLYENGAPHVVPVEDIAAGRMKFTITQPTTFSLEAVSDAGVTMILSPMTQTVSIMTPVIIPTPLPQPVITRFDVSPSDVISGQQVLVQWDVAGPADALTVTLMMNGVPAVVPASGALFLLPQAEGDGVRIFQLIADNGNGQVPVNATKLLNVKSPTPRPVATQGPIGKPDYDAACGGAGRADLRQLGQFWRWVCLDKPTEDISDKVCRDQFGKTAFAKAEDVGRKETWMCWH